MKPETLKSILSLVRNADGRTSAVSGSTSSSIKDDGDKSQHGVTSYIRDAGSDDVTRDVTGERSSPVGDAAVEEPRRSASETCDALQDEQMRLANEGQCLVVSCYMQAYFMSHIVQRALGRV